MEVTSVRQRYIPTACIDSAMNAEEGEEENEEKNCPKSLCLVNEATLMAQDS